MLVDKAPRADLIYVKVDKPGVLVFPACELLLSGTYDSSKAPDIIFKTPDGKQTFTKRDNFTKWLKQLLKDDWGELQDYIIHPEGKPPSTEIQNFWKTYNTN